MESFRALQTEDYIYLVWCTRRSGTGKPIDVFCWGTRLSKAVVYFFIAPRPAFLTAGWHSLNAAGSRWAARVWTQLRQLQRSLRRQRRISARQSPIAQMNCPKCGKGNVTVVNLRRRFARAGVRSDWREYVAHCDSTSRDNSSPGSFSTGQSDMRISAWLGREAQR